MSGGGGVRGSTTTNGPVSVASSTSDSGGRIRMAPLMSARCASSASTVRRWAASPALRMTCRPCSSRVSAIDETIAPK
jgi:hypothetical protein